MSVEFCEYNVLSKFHSGCLVVLFRTTLETYIIHILGASQTTLPVSALRYSRSVFTSTLSPAINNCCLTRRNFKTRRTVLIYSESSRVMHVPGMEFVFNSFLFFNNNSLDHIPKFLSINRPINPPKC